MYCLFFERICGITEKGVLIGVVFIHRYRLQHEDMKNRQGESESNHRPLTGIMPLSQTLSYKDYQLWLWLCADVRFTTCQNQGIMVPVQNRSDTPVVVPFAERKIAKTRIGLA